MLRSSRETPEVANSPAHPKATLSSRYAYLSRYALVVESGTDTVHALGTFYVDSNLLWTKDRRYVVALSNEKTESATLIALDTELQRSQRIPCFKCSRIIQGGAHDVVTVDDQRQLIRIDVATQRPSPTIVADLSEVAPHVNPLASSNGHILVAGLDPEEVSAYGGPESLWLVDEESGSTTAVGSGGDTTLKPGAGSDTNVYGGPRMAIAPGWHAGACEQGSNLQMIDAATGKLGADIPTPEPVTDLYSGGNSVTDMWFGSDGAFHITFQAWKCPSGDPSRLSETSGLWRLEPNLSWKKLTDGPLASARLLEDGSIVALVRTPDSDSHRLELRQQQATTVIAPEAFAIASP